ncbi:DUF6454 family protein [Agilicoccus flavus]|uniref:DUF6454 family protein n=1 Tax=Agilicoccus flavus TaxID=2775968 RepID=UPI001CF6D968|nr:DUF6454 family protein [Agilicoccus flavus]
MPRHLTPLVHVAVGAVLVGGGLAASPAASAAPPGRDHGLETTIRSTDRTTAWTLTDTLDLSFDTFHPQGLVVTRDRIYLSSVEIIEPTTRYPKPVDGMDRTPGKGVGHLFVMDRAGKLLRDIRLGEGDNYHPGGIDVDGRNIWVSVAQYRPHSSAIVYRVDTRTLRAQRMFEVDDHVGGLVYDKATQRLVGNSWGSRRFYEWTLTGRELRSWANTSHFIDYQDCKYVQRRNALCTGVTNLPTQKEGVAYELGGYALLDLSTGNVLHEVPFQQWSTAGHVATRNPTMFTSSGDHLTMYAAPDDAEEGKGTQILTYEADVSGAR